MNTDEHRWPEINGTWDSNVAIHEPGRATENLFASVSIRVHPWLKAAAVWSLLVILSGLLTAGCSQSESRSPEFDSRIFSRVEIIGERGTAMGQFTKPRSLTVDLEDNLYVVDMTGRVQKFSPDGQWLDSWRMPETDLGKPKGMCRDAEGNVVIVEPHYQRVNHFAPSGRLVTQWGVRGTNAGQLTLPRSVAINSQGNIFVSEYTTVDRVQSFSRSSHEALACFGQPGTAHGEFNRAEGLGIDRQDRVYVADSCNHRVQIFSPEGHWLGMLGRAGKAAGELSYPYDVRIDSEGRIYVCEFGNSRIQVFDANRQSIELVGGPGSQPGKFNNPWAIALDSRGNLYVADAGNHRVQKLVRR